MRLLEQKRLLVAALLFVVLVAAESSLTFDPFVIMFMLLVLAVAGVLPFALGFALQWLLRDRVLPDWAFVVVCVVLMLPWWFWGVGFHVSVVGPRAFSFVISVVVLAWFSTYGASVARFVRRRRESGLAPSSSEDPPIAAEADRGMDSPESCSTAART